MFIPLTMDDFVARILRINQSWTKQVITYLAMNPHYTIYSISKRSSPKNILVEDGEHKPKMRIIAEPCPALKQIQEYILRMLLNPAMDFLLPCAHGCVPERSTVTNALPHVGAKLWIHMDLKDFFPSVKAQRVYGMYHKIFGYEEKLAWLLTRLACFEGKLPQGAPTSPAIANFIATPMDRRLLGLANAMGLFYTRYVDDLTFSFRNRISKANIDRFIKTVGQIVTAQGFTVNQDKTGVVSRKRRKTVTGIVVNDVPSIPKEFRSNLRAALHHRLLEAPTADSDEKIGGKLAYVKMVRPGQAEAILRSYSPNMWGK